jgi:predicted Zn-ribbon and HTH transcriptional regulator
MLFLAVMSTPALKKRSNTLDVKLADIRAAEANNNHSELSRTFGIHRPTIMTILKEKEKILQVIEAEAEKDGFTTSSDVIRFSSRAPRAKPATSTSALSTNGSKKC